MNVSPTLTDRREPAYWSLDVTGGPNQGATVQLAPGRYRLGNSADSDIMLADETIAADQIEIDIAESAAGITALAVGGVLQNRALLLGQKQRLRGAAQITIGETRLSLRPPPGVTQAALHRRLSASVLIGAAALVSAAFVFLALTPAGMPQPQSTDRAAASSPQPASQIASRATATLQEKLRALGLDGQVSVRADDHVVLATGAVIAADQPAWTQAQSWFDAHYSGAVPLVSHVGTAATSPNDGPKLDIAAVSMLPVPCIITQTGDRFTEGAVIDGSWVVSHIAADAITLRHGTREIRMTL